MKGLKSFAYAWNGLRICFVQERNFRIHILITGAVLIFAVLLNISAVEWMFICCCIAFVLVTELLNTAVEKLCDLAHPEIHPGIKKIKDIAAAAVLIAAFFSLLVAVIIFLPKLIFYLKSYSN